MLRPFHFVVSCLLGWTCALVAPAAAAEPMRPLFGAGSDPAVSSWRVQLGPLLASDDACNDVDRWLLDIARGDGVPMVLEASDFIRGMDDATVEAFLAAASRYVVDRWVRGDRSEQRATRFLDDIRHLSLPPRFTVFALYGTHDIGRLRRGHLVGAVAFGSTFAGDTIQDQAVDWSLLGRSVGGAGLWPWRADPYQGRWPLLYLGLGLVASHATGEIASPEQRLGKVNLFALDFLVEAHLRYTLSPTWLLKAGLGTGFGVGTLRVERTWDDELGGLADPCALDPDAGLDLNAASAAVRCTVSNSFGFFHTFPVVVSTGVELLGWLNVDLVYRYAPLVVDPSQFAPDAMQDLHLRLGVNVY